MEAQTVLTLVAAADSIKSTLQEYLDELARLSPSEIELVLGVTMKDTKPSDRLEALLKHLDAKPANLRLQIRREHGRLVFGTFWLPGETRLFSLDCPASIQHYLDVPSGKQVFTAFRRELLAALVLLANRLEVDPSEVLRQELIYALDRHHSLIEAMIGSPAARNRHRRELAELAKQGVFWQEIVRVLEMAREEVGARHTDHIPELQPT
jgi:hypothetical protein